MRAAFRLLGAESEDQCEIRVLGSPSCGASVIRARSEKLLDEVYAPIVARGTPKVVTDYATAEMVKTAANSFLATKISFINAMAELREATGTM